MLPAGATGTAGAVVFRISVADWNEDYGSVRLPGRRVCSRRSMFEIDGDGCSNVRERCSRASRSGREPRKCCGVLLTMLSHSSVQAEIRQNAMLSIIFIFRKSVRG
jgi:hypothetical protein